MFCDFKIYLTIITTVYCVPLGFFFSTKSTYKKVNIFATVLSPETYRSVSNFAMASELLAAGK